MDSSLWKQTLFSFVYTALVVLFIIGIIDRTPTWPLFGLLCGLLVALVTDAWGFRSRSPVLNGSNKPLAAAGWIGVVAVTALLASRLPRPTSLPFAAGPDGSATPVATLVAEAASGSSLSEVPATPLPLPTVPPPTPTPAATPISLPPPPPPPPVSLAASPLPSPSPPPTVVPTRLIVANVGSQDALLRRTPATGERVASWPSGTEMIWLGEEQQAAERNWKRVRDPDGNEGWMASDLLAPRDTP